MKRRRSNRNINGVSPENAPVASQTFTTVNITPLPPDDGSIKIYAKTSDESLYYLDSNNVETPLLSGEYGLLIIWNELSWLHCSAPSVVHNSSKSPAKLVYISVRIPMTVSSCEA